MFKTLWRSRGFCLACPMHIKKPKKLWGRSTFWITWWTTITWQCVHSSSQRKRLQVQKYPGGSKLTSAAAWRTASPNHLALNCFSFLQSFVWRCRSALCVLSHPKTSGEGNRQVAGQRNMLISAWRKIEQIQHAQDWHQVLGHGDISTPLLRSSIRPVCKYPCKTLVKCRSCSAPFAGFPDISGLVFAYEALLSSEIM